MEARAHGMLVSNIMWKYSVRPLVGLNISSSAGVTVSGTTSIANRFFHVDSSYRRRCRFLFTSQATKLTPGGTDARAQLFRLAKAVQAINKIKTNIDDKDRGSGPPHRQLLPEVPSNDVQPGHQFEAEKNMNKCNQIQFI